MEQGEWNAKVEDRPASDAVDDRKFDDAPSHYGAAQGVHAPPVVVFCALVCK